MSCRFPGASGVEDFWKLLSEGCDAVTEVPIDRFDVSTVYDVQPQTPGKTVSRHGGFISDAFGFDADFFKIAPVEARGLDPQQRLLLQVAWEGLEHAGIRPSTLAGSRTAVFVGQATAEYGELCLQPNGIREAAGSRLRAVTAGRLSYTLDLRGPSLTVDTACSSSLVAVHLARQSLLAGECDLAIAAGVNIIHTPTDSITYSQGGMLSPSGRCRFGDANADGFVRGEGIGVVVLKRTMDAEAGRDPIRALLLGSSVNNDGQGSGLLLQPAISGQVAMLRQAYADAGVPPTSVHYVEAHGTGTRVGDGVELSALAQVFSPDRAADQPLWIGSVKTNIGHAEAAAGIAGLIKAVLILRHRTIPASLHVQDPNPILADAPIRVATTTVPLAGRDGVAIVGVSSFGIAGTNSHAVLSAPAPRSTSVQSDETSARSALLLLSARSQGALSRTALRFAEYLEGEGANLSLSAICAAAATRRDHHRFRGWVVGRSHADLSKSLRGLANGVSTVNSGYSEVKRNIPPIAFVFPGQGAQWPGMARGLMGDPVFRGALERCDQVVRSELGWSVTDRLSGTIDETTDISVIQPLLWSIQISLVALWKYWGVVPEIVIGHSMGEVAAAYAAGALTLEDAAAVICRRSRLLQRLAGSGSMMLVGIGIDDAKRLVEPYSPSVAIAASNSPTATVLAGDTSMLEAIARRLDYDHVLARTIRADVASHSPRMEVLRSDLLSELAAIRPNVVETTMISTVTTQKVLGSELDASYWMNNLRNPVNFSDAIRCAVAEKPTTLFVEIGSHPILVGAVKEIQTELGIHPSATATLVRDNNEFDSLARVVGLLHLSGCSIDLQKYFGDSDAYLSLPSYEWSLRHFQNRAPASEKVGRRVVTELPLDLHEQLIHVGSLKPVTPATYLLGILAAANTVEPQDELRLEGVSLVASVDADETLEASVQIALQQADVGSWRASVAVVLDDGPSQQVCTAAIRSGVSPTCGTRTTVDSTLTRCHSFVSKFDVREAVARRGMAIDPAFPLPIRVWHSDQELVAQIGSSISLANLIESCFIALYVAIPGFDIIEPVEFGDVRICADVSAWTSGSWAVIQFAPTVGGGINVDATIFGNSGDVLADMRNVAMRRRARPDSRLAKDCTRPTIPEVRGALTPADIFMRHLGDVLEASPQSIDTGHSFRDLGVDSLMAADLAKRLRRDGLAGIGPATILSSDSIVDLLENMTTSITAQRTTPEPSR
ncbi:type I polyketide synthase [Nocardia salmonicida]|uniref:type I polyketide synthase n=1 Tax=Nocardia salmonicida TaxID=53431 RepID=UPI0037B46341